MYNSKINNINQKINYLEENNINGYKNYHKIYSDLKKNLDFEQKYKDKLINQFNDISTLKNEASNIKTFEFIEKISLKKEDYIIHPSVLDPLIFLYEEKINIISKQNNYLSEDLQVLSKYVEVLLDDNKKIRSYLIKKENEIKNYLELNLDNEGSNTFSIKNKEMEKEINILVFKIQELTEEKKIRENKLEEVENYNNKTNLILEKLKEDIFNIKNVNKKLAETKNLLEFRLDEIENELNNKQENFDKNEIKYKELKKKFKNKEEAFKDLKKNYEELNKKKQDIDLEYINEKNKLREQVKNLNKKINELEINNNKIRNENNDINIKLANLIKLNEKINNKIEVGKNKNKVLKMKLKNLSNFKENLKEKNVEYNNIEEIEQYEEKINELNLEIKNLKENNQNNNINKIKEKYEKEIESLKEENNYLNNVLIKNN